MKKYFFVGLGLVLALTLLVVAYGAYLNERGESQIALRMEERQAELIGEKAARRAFHPLVKFSAVNLYTASIADAVALTEGRIVEAYASVNSYVHKGDLLFRLENDNQRNETHTDESSKDGTQQFHLQSLDYLPTKEDGHDAEEDADGRGAFQDAVEPIEKQGHQKYVDDVENADLDEKVNHS